MNSNLNGNYCMYLRKSRTDREVENLNLEDTLARHEHVLTALAASLKISVTAVYREVVSGDSIAARPMVQQLLSEVGQGLWDGVLAMDIDRLARGDTIDQGIISQTFKYSGTKIITPSKIYNPDNEFDEEYFEFGLFMSRREYKTINRRLQRGRLASVNEGKFIGSVAPYGYIKVKIPNAKGYTLEIDEPRADVIRMIFNLYCHGETDKDGRTVRLGCDAIAGRLDALGFPPPADDKWSRATIRDIISNPTYAGFIRWGFDKEYKVIEGGTVTKVRRRNPDCSLVPGLHPAIITPELFELAKKARVANTLNTVPANKELKNPFSGIIYCEKCGAMMTRLGVSSKQKYDTLRCPNRYCDNVSAPLFLIEEEVLSFLSQWLQAYNVNPKSQTATPFDMEIASRKQGIASIEKEMRTLQTQQDNLYDLLEQGVYSIDIFQKRQDRLVQQLAELSEKRSVLQAEADRFTRLLHMKAQFAPKVSSLLAGYHTNTPAANNSILKEVLERVDYCKTERNTRGRLETRNFSLRIFPRLPD